MRATDKTPKKEKEIKVSPQGKKTSQLERSRKNKEKHIAMNKKQGDPLAGVSRSNKTSNKKGK